MTHQLSTVEYRGFQIRAFSHKIFGGRLQFQRTSDPDRYTSDVRIESLYGEARTAFVGGYPTTATQALEPAIELGKRIVDDTGPRPLLQAQRSQQVSHTECALDEALAETFPASDPVAVDFTRTSS